MIKEIFLILNYSVDGNLQNMNIKTKFTDKMVAQLGEVHKHLTKEAELVIRVEARKQPARELKSSSAE